MSKAQGHANRLRHDGDIFSSWRSVGISSPFLVKVKEASLENLHVAKQLVHHKLVQFHIMSAEEAFTVLGMRRQNISFQHFRFGR